MTLISTYFKDGAIVMIEPKGKRYIYDGCNLMQAKTYFKIDSNIKDEIHFLLNGTTRKDNTFGCRG